jgi:ferrochelatase
MTERTAVVLFNLGGPDRPDAVKPFLVNLFKDPAIIAVPQPLRWLLAHLIAGRRARAARSIYEKIGGGSPLLANTEAQAKALEAALAELGPVKVFVAMRYWHPLVAEVAAAVKAYEPTRVVLLPLYPQFSTTTTGSAFTEWRRAAAVIGLAAPTHGLCCYPTEPGWIAAIAGPLRRALAEATDAGRPRVLFSAHGLPKKTVAAGDPYQWQVEASAAAIVAGLGEVDLDWVVCYQSRVGPLEWIGPSTAAEIERAGQDRVPVIVVPIAFVSEHSETLVELDIEYRDEAARMGVPRFIRLATVGVDPVFIAGLAGLVRTALARPPGLASEAGPRLCPARHGRCPLGAA